MDDITDRLDNHEDRIKSLEQTRMDTLRALSELDGKHEHRLREVKADLQERMRLMDTSAKERDSVNATRLDRFETKMDGLRGQLNTTLDTVRRAPPLWVGPLIGVLIAAAGWGIEIALRAHG